MIEVGETGYIDQEMIRKMIVSYHHGIPMEDVVLDFEDDDELRSGTE